MAANNETGVIQPLAEISRLCREAGALLLVDAVTAAGKIDLDFALVRSHDAVGAQVGRAARRGALILKSGAPFAPMTGRRRTERAAMRAGTENLAGIAGFGATANRRAVRHREVPHRGAARPFRTELPTRIPGTVFSVKMPRAFANTSNVALPGISGGEQR